MERQAGLADPSGWWRLSIAEVGFLATKHPRARLAAAAELVHYRQTGRFMGATDDLPPGVVAERPDGRASAGQAEIAKIVARMRAAARQASDDDNGPLTSPLESLRP